MTSGDLHEEAARRLRRREQRYTAGRRRLVDTLAALGRPATIADLLAADEALAQSSAYRNLTTLEDATVVRRVTSTDEFARFELAEELTGHHHHLICTTCGAVEDVTIPSDLESALDRAIGAIEARTGFHADQHRLDLLGTCATSA